MYAKDKLVSVAKELPENLLLDAVNDHGLFTSNLLLRLKQEEFCDLRKEARKHQNDKVFLFFYEVPEKDLGKKAPHQVTNYASFDFSKVVKVLFNGSTAPFLEHNYLNPIYYISVTLVTKDA